VTLQGKGTLQFYCNGEPVGEPVPLDPEVFDPDDQNTWLDGADEYKITIALED
jgi:hypothetical protein